MKSRLLSIKPETISKEDAVAKIVELNKEANSLLNSLNDEMERVHMELFDIAQAMDIVVQFADDLTPQNLINYTKVSSKFKAKSQAVKSSSSLIYFIE